MSKIHLAEEFTLEQVMAPVNFKLKVLWKKMSGIQLILILLAVAINHA